MQEKKANENLKKRSDMVIWSYKRKKTFAKMEIRTWRGEGSQKKKARKALQKKENRNTWEYKVKERNLTWRADHPTLHK